MLKKPVQAFRNYVLSAYRSAIKPSRAETKVNTRKRSLFSLQRYRRRRKKSGISCWSIQTGDAWGIETFWTARNGQLKWVRPIFSLNIPGKVSYFKKRVNQCSIENRMDPGENMGSCGTWDGYSHQSHWKSVFEKSNVQKTNREYFQLIFPAKWGWNETIRFLWFFQS